MKSLKKLIFIIPLLFVYTVVLACESSSNGDEVQPPKKATLRIGSYNVYYCKSNTGNPAFTDQNTKNVASVIDALDYDILSVQELDSGFVDRQNKRYLLADIASRTKKKYHYIYGAAHGFGTASVGVGVLVNQDLKVLSTKQVALPGEERRTLLMVEFDKFWFIATHYDLIHENRVESSKIVMQEIKKLNKPVYLAGDLNINNTTNEAYNILAQSFVSVTPLTYNDGKLRNTIDYVLYSDNGTGHKPVFKGSKVETEMQLGEKLPLSQVSDHPPIWVNIEVD
ncbi:endonuclease/exonuclease/phosphatase family protein [Sphingobacterium paucimobilis]|uniref:Endonuclease/exonuclease/phosphatase domain-containing protein n=1 Tax=Sphingobacterium paucimobilis HER1398 TaxID=1346330 RepID=U2J9K4_9SPHI|nr:endonuclease/exonuclease/phosphatase family protein [Sphingobacterium paucimobilis]ERJ59353.1 hypothetical protein M472_11270 [Sphingobacterium paucimobilis HER1398]